MFEKEELEAVITNLSGLMNLSLTVFYLQEIGGIINEKDSGRADARLRSLNAIIREESKKENTEASDLFILGKLTNLCETVIRRNMQQKD